MQILKTGIRNLRRCAETGAIPEIKVNHAIHMKPIRRGPNGANVQLECEDCHQAGAASADWRYADARYTSANTSYSTQDEVLALEPGELSRPVPMSGRELMAPVRFAYACAGCHSLSFDKRFEEGAPHDKPEVVHTLQRNSASTLRRIRVVRVRDLGGI